MQEIQVGSLCKEDAPGRVNSNPLQYSFQDNPMDKEGLVGYSSLGLKELDTTERLHFHLSGYGSSFYIGSNRQSHISPPESSPVKYCENTTFGLQT